MGVYVFTWSKLRQYLIDVENDPDSNNDFGKNVIPKMHADGEKMFAYLFDGYWKDVGTIDSLWEANLDLLNPKVDLDLSDTSWKIYAKTPVSPPHYISADAKVQNSMISEGSRVYGDVDYSILFNDVVIEEGAEVKYSIIMPGTVVKKGAVVQYAMVAENAVIEAGAVVGASPEEMTNRDDWGVAVVGAGVTVCEGAFVAPKTQVSDEVVKEKK